MIGDMVGERKEIKGVEVGLEVGERVGLEVGDIDSVGLRVGGRLHPKHVNKHIRVTASS